MPPRANFWALFASLDCSMRDAHISTDRHNWGFLSNPGELGADDAADKGEGTTMEMKMKRAAHRRLPSDIEREVCTKHHTCLSVCLST